MVNYDYTGNNAPICTDVDSDGYGSGTDREDCTYTEEDCDDSDNSINPSASEVCDDGIDNDCNGDADCADSACVAEPACAVTITFNDLGAVTQYGYTHNYGGAAASFTYNTPSDDKISGTFTATGLKPYETYQLKFEGKPVCAGGSDDLGNEYIGYLGRWWNNTVPTGNVDDSYYENNSVYHSGTKCIVGYLVWGYVTADASGNVTKAVSADSSYHVLWCSGGTCGSSNNLQLNAADGSIYPYCYAADVNGQIERGTCGSLSFSPGVYDLKMILNEESFHQNTYGVWTAVMDSDINFSIY